MTKQIQFAAIVKTQSVFFFFLLLSMSSIAQPQKGQFDISGSIGLISGVAMLGDNLPQYETVSSQSPNFFVSGKYFINNRIALGMAFGTQTINGSDVEQVSSYTAKSVNYTFAPEVTFIYTGSDDFQFYALIGIGIDSYTEYITSNYHFPGPQSSPSSTNSKALGTDFSPQITPLGFRFGGQLGAYIELGIGYKGLLNGGIAYTIGKAKVKKAVK